MAALIMGGKGGSGASAEQTLQESKNWAKLRRHYEQQGGVGYKRDLRVRVIGVKHPHEITTTVNGAKVLVNWGVRADGTETPAEDRFKTNDHGKRVPMQPGVLITFESVEPGVEGLRFYASGTYSGNEKTALFKVGKALFGAGITGQQIDPDTDYIDKELLITVEMGNDHDRKTADGAPAKAGCYWNVRDYRPVPRAAASLADDDGDDEVPVNPTMRASAPSTPGASASPSSAPVATTAGARSSASPTSGGSIATADDDDDFDVAPF
jgi:hypothetical protein